MKFLLKWAFRLLLVLLVLLAVVWIAIRGGRTAGILATAVGVMGVNYFFQEPFYSLRVADAHSLLTLVVFAVTALVIGQLASRAREEAGHHRHQAEIARERSHEVEVLHAVSERVAADLRGRVYAHMQSLSLDFFSGRRTGDLMSRGLADTQQLQFTLTLLANDSAPDGGLAITSINWLTDTPQRLDDAPGEWHADADGAVLAVFAFCLHEVSPCGPLRVDRGAMIAPRGFRRAIP